MACLVVTLTVIDAVHLLLIRRSDVAVWALPGGLVQPHESVADAAVREVAEETGLAIRLTRPSASTRSHAGAWAASMCSPLPE